MKSFNIKKAAAVAAGTALLVGSALAALPGKDFYYDASGNTNVQIVMGDGDGLAAARLAAAVAGGAHVDAGGSVTPDATGEAKIGVLGAASTLPEASVRSDLAWNAGIGAAGLVLGSSKGLEKGTITFNANEYDYEEEVSVASVAFGYNEGTDYHGLGFTTTKPNKINYKFKFLDTFVNPNGNLNQTVTIPFLGESYVLNKLKTTEAELVKGEEVRLGIGQQTDVTVGATTYTVTLDSADLDETTTPNTGQATVTVSGGDLTSSVTLQLDTSNDQSGSAGDTLVYLQSVAKSYTPGQGGSATLRVGGSVLTLKDGQAVDASASDWKKDWKTSIQTSGTGISGIWLVYNVNNQAKEVVDEITGPEGYFQLKYLGDEVARGTWSEETVVIGSTDSDDPALDTLTFTENNYEDTYTIDLNDDLNQTVFLTYNSSVGYLGTVNPTDSAGAATYNATSEQYLPVYEDGMFFVADTPVKVISFSTSTAAANAQVQFSVGYGGDNPTTKTVKASECTAGAAVATCTNVNMIGSNAISFAWNWNSSAFTATDYMNVTAGADNDIDTMYTGTITFGTTTNNMYNTTTHLLGPYNVTFTDIGGTAWPVLYTNTTTNPGIATTGINQATNNAGDNQNMYQWTANAWAEALDTDTVQFKNAETTTRTQRVAIVRGEVEGEAGEGITTVTTSDTLPYTVTSGVTVKELTCTAEAVATGVSFGVVSDDLVVSDAVDPTGNAIVVGGHYANRLAVGMTEGTLTAAGTSMTELSGNTLYVAGYTAADTLAAVDELVAAIKAL